MKYINNKNLLLIVKVTVQLKMISVLKVILRQNFKSKLDLIPKRFIYDERFLRIDRFREEQGKVREKYIQTKGN